MKKQKIAVIGGGMSAMASVYSLLKASNFDDSYDITVYQLGWRIGGKGASGRNPKIAQRIEEHGLHMWFGMYNNAFNIIQDCYNRLNRPKDAPLATWQDAFKPHHTLVATEWFDNKWHFNQVSLPTNGEEPGGSNEFLKITDYIQMALEMLFNRVKSEIYIQTHPSKKAGCIGWLTKPFAKNLMDEIQHHFETVQSTIRTNESAFYQEDQSVFDTIVERIGKILIWIKNEIGQWMSHNESTRCMFILLDVGLTTLLGIIKDKVLYYGFDSINKYDFIEWLTLHGASPISTESALVRGAYNAMFAYSDGDDKRPNMEAGTSLKASLLILGIKGAPFWKMQAGMGDTVFTPLYEVLKKHGVKFKFFHKAEAVQLSEDKKEVNALHFGIQATLKEGIEAYNPLVDVKGLPCWPSVPNYEQLVEGDELQNQNINLESFWTPWKDPQKIVLQKGIDFDQVILGVSIDSIPHIAGEVVANNPRVKAMVDQVKTTPTQAFQLWMKKDFKALGWKFSAGILGAYAQPLDTWAGMNQLLDKEEWPSDMEPGSISYWCGPLKAPTHYPPATDYTFPAKMEDTAKGNMEKYVNNDLQQQWPNAFVNNQFDFNGLIAPADDEGKERLNKQFWRANVDPSERYVLTVKGSSAYRLKTNETGVNNLYFTGDWIDNGFNFGCIEACAIAGIRTARAISGLDIPIVGEVIFDHK